VITLSKQKLEAHLNSLSKTIARLEKDLELLRRWSKMAKLMPAQRLSLVLKDSVEELSSGLADLKSSFEKPSTSLAKARKKDG